MESAKLRKIVLLAGAVASCCAFAETIDEVVSIGFDQQMVLSNSNIHVQNIVSRGRIVSKDNLKWSQVAVGVGDVSGCIAAGFPTNTILRKIGTGTFTATAPFPCGMVIDNGEVAVSRAGAKYRNYRFKIESVYGSKSTSAEVGEIKLLDGDSDVTRPYASVSRSSVGTIEDWRGVARAFNGIVYNDRWNEPNAGMTDDISTRDEAWAKVSYSSPLEITHYLWATGVSNPYYNDTHSWPTGWRLQGSDNGTEWIDIDAVSYLRSTSASSTWVNASIPFPCGAYAGSTVFHIASGGSLSVGAGEFACGSIYNSGAVSVASGAALAFSSKSGETARLSGGGVSGAGGIVKSGSGTLAMHGGNTYSGDTVVREGMLKVAASAPSPQWFRFTFRKVNGGKELCLSELKLFDAEGARVGIGISRATSVGTFAANQPVGTVCQESTYPDTWTGNNPEALFDGDTNTNWRLSSCCLTNNAPESSWVIATIRLPADANPVTSYNFTAPTPTYWNQYRPESWLVEASYDGCVWFTADDRTGVASPNTNGKDYSAGPFALALCGAGGFGAAIPSGSVVEVASGATLDVEDTSQTIRALRVDMASGAGTITRFRPAANGVLHLVNATGTGVVGALSVTVGSFVDADNLSSWKVMVDGKERRCKVAAKNGVLEILPVGMVLWFR